MKAVPKMFSRCQNYAINKIGEIAYEFSMNMFINVVLFISRKCKIIRPDLL